MKTKKKIIVDLDVVTVSIWDKKGENSQLATEFIGRIKNEAINEVLKKNELNIVKATNN